MEGMCDDVRRAEEMLGRTSVFCYDRPHHRHQISCESCRRAAPWLAALSAEVADEQFRRVRSYLTNLVECLDFDELKLKRIAAALGKGEDGQDEVRNALLWRAFLLVNYLPHVADLFVYCAKPQRSGEIVNPWVALRKGAGDATAVEFVRSIARQEFEAAVLTCEVLAAIPDYMELLAYREVPYPMPTLRIPAGSEGLEPIPGFLEIIEGATDEQWSNFVEETLAEQMPWWGFDVIGGLIRLAAKSAGAVLAESGINLSGSPASERLEAIGDQVSAIYGAQLPMIDLQEGTRRAVDGVAQQQGEQADILRQIRDQLSRPTKAVAESSLRKILGDAIYHSLSDEARAAVVEGELRFLQRDLSTLPSYRSSSRKRSNASCGPWSSIRCGSGGGHRPSIGMNCAMWIICWSSRMPDLLGYCATRGWIIGCCMKRSGGFWQRGTWQPIRRSCQNSGLRGCGASG